MVTSSKDAVELLSLRFFVVFAISLVGLDCCNWSLSCPTAGGVLRMILIASAPPSWLICFKVAWVVVAIQHECQKQQNRDQKFCFWSINVLEQLAHGANAGDESSLN